MVVSLKDFVVLAIAKELFGKYPERGIRRNREYVKEILRALEHRYSPEFWRQLFSSGESFTLNGTIRKGTGRRLKIIARDATLCWLSLSDREYFTREWLTVIVCGLAAIGVNADFEELDIGLITHTTMQSVEEFLKASK